ncbi:MAG: PAC2 family protein [Candidatus Methanoperedens sp.]|nr:PAC2 family protein [Candidatus Methanoperedens sp.]
MEITMHKYKELDLKGATVINGFPSSGLVNTIVASYLVSALKLDQICGLDSEDFPPVSMIYASKPKFPARIYADAQAKVVVFVSEFTPHPKFARAIARTMLSFAEEAGCTRIISPETLIVEEAGIDIFCIGSTDAAREEIERVGLKPLLHTIISGISGVLLNEGRIRNYNVIVPLSLRGMEISDARAAAQVIDVIDKLIPTIEIDLEPLYMEAERVEKHIKALRKQIKPEYSDEMYG